MPDQNELTPGAGDQQVRRPTAALPDAPAQQAQVAAPAQVKPTARPAAKAKTPTDDRDDFIRNAVPVAAALRRSGKPEEAKQLETVASAVLQTKSLERTAAPEQQAPGKEKSIKDLLASVYKAIDQDPALKNMPEAKEMRRAGNKLDKDGMLNITVRNGVVTSFLSNFTDNLKRTSQVDAPEVKPAAGVAPAPEAVPTPASAQAPVVAAPAPAPEAVPTPAPASEPIVLKPQVSAAPQLAPTPATTAAQVAPGPQLTPSKGEVIYSAAPPTSDGVIRRNVLSSQAAHNSVFQIQVDPKDGNRAILLPAPRADGRLINSLRDSMDNSYEVTGRPEVGKQFLAVQSPTQLERTAEGWRVTEKGVIGFAAAASVYQAQQLAPVQPAAQHAAQGPAGTARILENARRAVSAATAPFSRADISVEELTKVGVQMADLEKSGNLQKLLAGEKTGLLPLVLPTADGATVPFEAKLVLDRDARGVVTLRADLPKHELVIPSQVMGKDVTPAMQQQLMTTGVVPLAEGFRDGQGKALAGYLAVDQEMKRVVYVRPEGISVPKEVYGARLSPEQQKSLLEGKPTRVEGMTHPGEKKLVDALVQLDPLKKAFVFRDTAARQVLEHVIAQTPPTRRQGARM